MSSVIQIIASVSGEGGAVITDAVSLAAAKAAEAEASAVRAEDAESGAVAAAGAGIAALALPPAKFSGLQGYRLGILSNVAADNTQDPPITGAVNLVADFARASAAWEYRGGSLVTYASGVNALGDGGIAVRPARTQLFGFAQDISNAAWTKALATVASAGTGPLGLNAWDVTNTATTGLHSFRQNETVVSGSQYTFVVLWKPKTTNTIAIAMGSAPFATGANPIVNCTTAGATLLSGTADGFGTVEVGNGYYLSWVTKTAASSATSSMTCYIKNSLSYLGAGESITVASCELYVGNVPVTPILTPTASNVSRAAETFSVDISGPTFSSFGSYTTDATRAPNGRFFALSNGTTTKEIAVINNAGSLQLRAVDGGSPVTVNGPAIPTVANIALSYNGSVVKWAVNGVDQPDLTVAITGLTKATFGHDGAGGNQFNGQIAYHETVKGVAAGLAEMTGGGGVVSGIEYAPDEVLLTGDGAGGAYVFTRATNSSDGQDYIRWHMSYRVNATQKCEGLASDAVFLCRRAGETSFTLGAQLTDANPAEDDSLFRSGAGTGQFIAILSGTTNHGFLIQTSARWVADGKVVVPASGVWVSAREIALFQDCDGYIPTTPAASASTVFMKRRARFKWNSDGKYYRPGWHFTTSSTIKAGSYPGMLSANGQGFSLATAQEGTANIVSGDTTDLRSKYPFMQISDATKFISIEVVSGFDDEAELWVQNGDTSAEDKVYFQPWATDRAVVNGDYFEWELLHRGGLM